MLLLQVQRQLAQLLLLVLLLQVHRLVPVVTKPEHIMIAVSGDPLRSNCYLFVHNGMLGFPVTKAVTLPRSWRAKLRDAQG